MKFAYPRILWLLGATLPLLSWFLWWAWRKRQSLIRQFVQSRLLAHLTVGVSTTLQKTRLALLVLAVTCLLLALARPQWGFTWEEARQRGLDIVVAIDTSRSMLAADIQPNRLERAKLAAIDLMRLAKNDRLGLVAFAGTAFLQCPLTLDEEAFRQSVNALDVGIIPQGGTALAEAIEAARTAFKDDGDNHKVLVLFTDGEDHEEGVLEAAKKAAQAGVKIFTVGVGTANGELLRQRDASGTLSYIKDDQGNVVKSRLNESLLTQVATAADGFYLSMSGARTVDVLYERGLAPLPKGESSSKVYKSYNEQYHWPLTLAIVLLLVEMLLPDRKRAARNEPSAATANAALRKAVALLCLGFATSSVWASPGGALRRYDEGQFKEAEREFERLLEKKPDDPKLHYNAGTAAYQAGDFDKARQHFEAALASPDLNLQQLAYYNLGNTLARLGQNQGEIPKKSETWEQSVKQYESALKLNQKDGDARFNLDLVKNWIAQLPKPPPQPNPNDPNSKEQNKDQKDKEQESKQKQEQPSQDKNQQGNKQDQQQQKEQEQKQTKNQSDEEKKQEQPQSAENKEKKDENKGNAQNQENDDSAGGAKTALGQMTPEQVKRLLDAQKNEEKAMIFVPPEKRQSKTRIFKDW